MAIMKKVKSLETFLLGRYVNTCTEICHWRTARVVNFFFVEKTITLYTCCIKYYFKSGNGEEHGDYKKTYETRKFTLTF
jgi:hypothetical protein